MNAKAKTKLKISYEPEADVLAWEISRKPIDYAKEIGNVVVHFTKEDIPVFIEILDAKKFVAEAKELLRKERSLVRKPAMAVR